MTDYKTLYPYCYSVAFKDSKYFRQHSFKVIEDKKFLQDAFKNNDIKTLNFMEFFYRELLKDYNTEKCIMSKKPYLTESFESLYKQKRKKRTSR